MSSTKLRIRMRMTISFDGSKKDFCSTLQTFFSRQQGGKKGGNDDWMCSGSNLERLLEHELVKKIDEW